MYDTEIYWEITALDGIRTVMEGGAPFSDGNMCTPTSAPSLAPTGIQPTTLQPTSPSMSPTLSPSEPCPDTCFGTSCMYWDQFGSIDGVCDYMGIEVEEGMGCTW